MREERKNKGTEEGVLFAVISPRMVLLYCWFLCLALFSHGCFTQLSFVTESLSFCFALKHLP